MKRYIRSNTQNEGFWYLSRHGIGPGTIPNDCHLIEVKDHETNRWKCYIKLNRVLTTEELKYYDLIEQTPKEVK